MSDSILFVIFIFGGFLFGSILFSKIFFKITTDKDIFSESADHNPGAYNVFTSCGAVIGLLALLCDMLKGFLPVFIARRYAGTESLLFALVMLAPVLGHAIGIFDRFQGGKSIATAFGVQIAMIAINWSVLLLAGLYILFSTLIPIRPNRVCSIVTFALFGILSACASVAFGQYSAALGNLLISATVVVKHIKREKTAEQKQMNN